MLTVAPFLSCLQWVPWNRIEWEVVEESTDPEGDDLDYDITWVVNGWANPGSTTESIVAGDLAADEAGSPPEHGDELRCRVRADDGMDTSTPAESEAVVLDNAPPTAGAPLVKPLEPKEGDELTCETSDASDPDGDAIQWTYTWKVNGEPVEGADEQTLSHAICSTAAGAGPWSRSTATTDSRPGPGTPASYSR